MVLKDSPKKGIKRGRPRKSINYSEKELKKSSYITKDTVLRKRGRPRKDLKEVKKNKRISNDSIDSNDEQIIQSVKKLGRPIIYHDRYNMKKDNKGYIYFI